MPAPGLRPSRQLGLGPAPFSEEVCWNVLADAMRPETDHLELGRNASANFPETGGLPSRSDVETEHCSTDSTLSSNLFCGGSQFYASGGMKNPASDRQASIGPNKARSAHQLPALAFQIVFRFAVRTTPCPPPPFLGGKARKLHVDQHAIADAAALGIPLARHFYGYQSFSFHLIREFFQSGRMHPSARFRSSDR